MKKQGKFKFLKFLFISIAIFAGFLVLYGIFFYSPEEQTAFRPGNGNLLALPVLLSQDNISATYAMSYSGEEISSGCDNDAEKSFSFEVMWYTNHGSADLPELVEGINTEKWFNTTTVTLTGYKVTTNSCSGIQGSGELVFDSLSAVCQMIDMGSFNAINRAGMKCIISGKVHPTLSGQPTTADIVGFSEGYIEVKTYKVGHEPVETLETYYFYNSTEETCIQVQLLPTQATNNHYETLQACQTQIPVPADLGFWSKIKGFLDSIIAFFIKVFKDLKFF